MDDCFSMTQANVRQFSQLGCIHPAPHRNPMRVVTSHLELLPTD